MPGVVDAAVGLPYHIMFRFVSGVQQRASSAGYACRGEFAKGGMVMSERGVRQVDNGVGALDSGDEGGLHRGKLCNDGRRLQQCLQRAENRQQTNARHTCTRQAATSASLLRTSDDACWWHIPSGQAQPVKLRCSVRKRAHCHHGMWES